MASFWSPVVAAACKSYAIDHRGWRRMARARWNANLSEVFVAQAVALATFGLIVAAAVARGAWFGRLNWSWRGYEVALLLVGASK